MYTSVKKFNECRILSNGEVIKYHIHVFISVVVIELSVRCLNTGSEDRLISEAYPTFRNSEQQKLKQVCAYAQTCQSIRCSHTQRMDEDEGRPCNSTCVYARDKRICDKYPNHVCCSFRYQAKHM